MRGSRACAEPYFLGGKGKKMSGGGGTRVYIGDLGSGGSKPELEKEFERYGPLKSVWVARNPPGKFWVRFC